MNTPDYITRLFPACTKCDAPQYDCQDKEPICNSCFDALPPACGECGERDHAMEDCPNLNV
jgi:hypothetical protein